MNNIWGLTLSIARDNLVSFATVPLLQLRNYFIFILLLSIYNTYNAATRAVVGGVGGCFTAVAYKRSLHYVCALMQAVWLSVWLSHYFLVFLAQFGLPQVFAPLLRLAGATDKSQPTCYCEAFLRYLF